MSRAIAEIQAELTLVNKAYAKLLAGEQEVELEVREGGFSRRYKFTAVTLDQLRALRKDLMDELAVANGDSGYGVKKMVNIVKPW